MGGVVAGGAAAAEASAALETTELPGLEQGEESMGWGDSLGGGWEGSVGIGGGKSEPGEDGAGA